eukprot:CAMPEP_0172824544 /NCGR_PEP_ID=MMETSP1075-20121228/18082_1 /TAXON_ID=2916 /ORGANISM="Ceratium fusus, Strain PA161109" /LENGTH=60 /DNA_ID=CAMNT_0013665847 /DNA_START=34 /DNA_END=213 /DNA_ORIENTATION=+
MRSMPTVPILATTATATMKLQEPVFPDTTSAGTGLQKLPGMVVSVKHEFVATISIGTPEQ